MTSHLSDGDLRALLPAHLHNDPALATAIEVLRPHLQAVARAVPNLLIFARLGGQPPETMLPPLRRLVEARGGLRPAESALLEQLAWQLHVDFREAARTDAELADLVLHSIAWHRIKGTPWAVRTALESALSVPADVEDWFTYGGKPYFFRVILDVTQAGMDEARMADALRIIRTAKNVRSWLDYVRTLSRPSLTLRHAVGVATAGRVTIAPWMPGDAPPLSLRTACGAQAVTRITLRPWRPAPPAPRLTAAACPGLTVHTRVRIAPSHHAGVAHV